ncbi:hypothetical protein [Paludisphaera sp.]|uniref:hypothetical protein n=1 Tax=Paludisphaera sp. TaxID=2017432 RepID=UPI00301D50B4
MTRRSELKDDESALIADPPPPKGRPGGRWNDHRTTLGVVLWILHAEDHRRNPKFDAEAYRRRNIV